MSIDTWAVVLATAVGPIGAVLISFWRESRQDRKDRRLYIFRTLMSTRRLIVSKEHVSALNLIEVEFFGHAEVMSKFNDYKNHLNSSADESQKWEEKREKLFALMLEKIGACVGVSIQAMNLYKDGYYPRRWDDEYLMYKVAMDFVKDLSDGSKSISVILKKSE